MSVRRDDLKHISDSGIYQSFFEHHPDAVFVSDLDGNYIDANPACVRVFGYSRDEFLRMSFEQMVAPEHLQSWRSKIVKQWHGGQSTRFETVMVRKDGQRVELDISNTPIVVDGTPIGVFGIAKDVTTQRDMERMLRERSERYESLKKYNPNGICSFRTDGSVIGANPAFEMMTGYTLDELRQMDVIGALLDPADRSLRTTFKSPFAENVECTIRHKDGHPVDVRLTNVPIIIDGELIGLYSILEDITEQKKMQDELLQIHQLFQLISENSQDVISVSTPEGICSYVSPSVQVLGYHPSELIGKPLVDLFHAEDVNYFKDIRDRMLQGEDFFRFTSRILLKSGNYLWYETTLRIIRNEQGEVSQLVGVGRDISEQMTLQESLENAVRIARLGHWERDLTTGVIQYSDQAYRNLGLDPARDTITFDKFKSLIHPEDKEWFERSVQAAVDTGAPLDRVYRAIRADGTMGFFHVRCEVMFDDAGVPVRLFGATQDITDLKTLELQLHESEQRYKKLVENSLDGIGVMENGKWVYMNTAGLKMFGAACMEDLRGRDPEDLLHPDHRAAARLRAQAILRGEPVGFVEMRFFRLDGQVFHAEVMGMPFGDHGIQVIIRDITRLKRMDELLLQAEKLSAVGQLAAGVAHEIRNPLTSLKGFTQILHEKAEYPERQYFDIMMAELDRIDSILGEMLLLAKPQEVHFQPWDVVPIVQEVVALLLTQAVIKNISVQTDFPAALPFVDCDKSQLKQVFLNVIKNAMEAMPQGGTVRVSGQVSAGDVCIDVMDQGEGIPADRLPKLGEPFFTTKEKGTGLGLMVSHRILAAHRGTMRFTSEPGKGTTVRICLPASRTGSQHLA